MTIEGLENSTYYFYNPIWVKVKGISQRIRLRLTISGASFDSFFEPIDGEVEFDLSKSLRGILPSFTNKTTLPPGGVVDGVYRVSVDFKSGSDREDFKKYFMAGGKDEFVSNISPGADLSLTNYVWDGWPAWRSRYITDEIVNAKVVSVPNIKRLYPRHDCESLMLAFRNLKGGFSQYVFEDFRFEKSNKDMGHYLLKKTIKDSGTETTVQLVVRTKAIREMYETLEHLGQSEEIYYRTLDVDQYVRLSGTNNVNFNYKNKTTDVSFSFDVVTNATKAR